MKLLLKFSFLTLTILILGYSSCHKPSFLFPSPTKIQLPSQKISTTNFLEYVKPKPKPKPIPITNPEEDFPNKNPDFNESVPDGTEKQIGYISGEKGIVGKTGEFVDSVCYNPPTSTTQPLTAVIKFSNSMSKSDLFHELGIAFNGSIGIKKVTVGAEMKFKNVTEENKFSSYFYYYAKLTRTRTFTYNIYLEDLLNNDGKEMFKQAKTSNDISFYIGACGDMVPKTVVEGAIVIIQVSVQFNSANEKQHFELGLHAGIKTKTTDLTSISANISANISSSKSKSNGDGKIHIKSAQFGGDSSQLFQMLPEDMNAECSNVVKSTGGKNDPNKKIDCTKKLQSVSEYFKKKFSTQFNGTPPPQYYFPFSFTKSCITKINLKEELN